MGDRNVLPQVTPVNDSWSRWRASRLQTAPNGIPVWFSARDGLTI
jgi:hypothetical protein